MSKSNKLRGSAARRADTSTSGSAYNNTLELGSDFLSELQDDDKNKLEAENEQLQEANRELAERLQTALVPVDKGRYAFGDLEFTNSGVEVPRDLNYDDSITIIQQMRQFQDAIQWVIGDIASHCERRWGKTYREIAQATGYEEQTIRLYVYVATNVELTTRINTLTFSHHRMVASLRNEEGEPQIEYQRHWLERAAKDGWSAKQLESNIKQARSLSDHTGQYVTSDSWLFAKGRIPRVTARMQTLWSKARNGDQKARDQFLEMLEDHQTWIDAARESLE